MLDRSSDGVRAQYLVICDSISQFLNEAIQDVGVVNILEKPHKPMLFVKQSKLCNNSSQLPAKTMQS